MAYSLNCLQNIQKQNTKREREGITEEKKQEGRMREVQSREEGRKVGGWKEGERQRKMKQMG